MKFALVSFLGALAQVCSPQPIHYHLGLTTLSHQAATLATPNGDYGLYVPEWEVEVFPGGDLRRFSGTVEEVHAQLLELNPNWDTDYPGGNNVDSTAAADDELTSLAKRTDFGGSQYFCRGRWAEADYMRVNEGIRYLRRIGGRPTNGAGPGNCGRVSCSYDAAIYWCNDVSHLILHCIVSLRRR